MICTNKTSRNWSKHEQNSGKISNIGTVMDQNGCTRQTITLIGPFQASILRAQNYILLFLGEVHSNIPEKTKGMLVWNFFQKVDDQRDVKLFIEQPVKPKPKENTKMFEIWLSKKATIGDIRRYVADCTSEKKEENNDCPFARTQVFSIDPRYDYGSDGDLPPIMVYDSEEVQEFIRKQNIFGFGKFLIDFQDRIFGTDDQFLNEKEKHLGLSRVIEPVRQILQEVQRPKETSSLEKSNGINYPIISK